MNRFHKQLALSVLTLLVSCALPTAHSKQHFPKVVSNPNHYLGHNDWIETEAGVVYFHVLDEGGARRPDSTTTTDNTVHTYFITHGFLAGVGSNWLWPVERRYPAVGPMPDKYEGVKTYPGATLFDQFLSELGGNLKLTPNDLVSWQALYPAAHFLGKSILYYHKNSLDIDGEPKNEKVNVVLVDWGDFSFDFWGDWQNIYNNAAKLRVPQVGGAISKYIINHGLDPAKVTLIGHSLGAHASGFAGQEIEANTGTKINTIIGMDAAGPFSTSVGDVKFTYNSSPPEGRLSVGDAENVYDIHTSAVWGSVYPLANYDLYVNCNLQLLQAGETMNWIAQYNHGINWEIDAFFAAVNFYYKRHKGFFEHLKKVATIWAGLPDHSYAMAFLSGMYLHSVDRNYYSHGALSSKPDIKFLNRSATYEDGIARTFNFYEDSENLYKIYTSQFEDYFTRNNSLRDEGKLELDIESFLAGNQVGGYFNTNDQAFNSIAPAIRPDVLGPADSDPTINTDNVVFWSHSSSYSLFNYNNTDDGYQTDLADDYDEFLLSPDYRNRGLHNIEYLPIRIVPEYEGLGVKITYGLDAYIPVDENTTIAQPFELWPDPAPGWKFSSWRNDVLLLKTSLTSLWDSIQEPTLGNRAGARFGLAKDYQTSFALKKVNTKRVTNDDQYWTATDFTHLLLSPEGSNHSTTDQPLNLYPVYNDECSDTKKNLLFSTDSLPTFPVSYNVLYDPEGLPNEDYDLDGINNIDDIAPMFNHLKFIYTPDITGAENKVRAYPVNDGSNYSSPYSSLPYSSSLPKGDPRRQIQIRWPKVISGALLNQANDLWETESTNNPDFEDNVDYVIINRPKLPQWQVNDVTFFSLDVTSGQAPEGEVIYERPENSYLIFVGENATEIDDMAFNSPDDEINVVFSSGSAPQLGDNVFSVQGSGSVTVTVPPDSTGYGNEGDLFGGIAITYNNLESFKNGTLVRGLLVALENGEAAVDMEAFTRFVSAILIDISEDYDIPAAVINPSMINTLANEYINEFSIKFGPTLASIRSALVDLDHLIQIPRDSLQTADDFLMEIEDHLRALVDANTALAQSASRILSDFEAQFDVWHQLYEGHFRGPEFEAELIAFLEQASFDMASEFLFPDIQLALRQRIQDLRSSIQAQIDSVFATVEQAVRDKITELVAGLDLGTIDSSFLSPLDEVCAYGELSGHIETLGDRVDLLRLDAQFEMKAPDKLKFAGYLEVKCLNSQGNGGCVYEGADFHEFTIGALDVPVGFLGTDVGMNIETSFTFADDAFPLRGLAGKFEMSRGEIEFESFKIMSMGAAAAFGQHENYLACEASLQLNQYKAAGGLFFGKTCTIDPLAIAHEQTANLLWDDSIGSYTGGLVYGFAAIPISEALGVPASCMFYVSAGLGGGVFYSIDGPTYGGIMELDVSGEALCALGVSGNLSLVGLKAGNDFRFSGSGRIGGRAGKCPFCLKFNKNVDIEYSNEKWKLDL